MEDRRRHRSRWMVPRPDIVSLEGIGHYPMVEAPQAVLEALLGFLGSERVTA